jgi:hypothetical protein
MYYLSVYRLIIILWTVKKVIRSQLCWNLRRIDSFIDGKILVPLVSFYLFAFFRFGLHGLPTWIIFY